VLKYLGEILFEHVLICFSQAGHVVSVISDVTCLQDKCKDALIPHFLNDLLHIVFVSGEGNALGKVDSCDADSIVYSLGIFER